MLPMQYAVYKGVTGKMGAVQFNLSSPHFYNDKQKDFTGEDAFEFVDGKRGLRSGWKQREGCIFMEITSATAPNVYDWENKVIIALSVTDLGKVLSALAYGQDTEIMHDPGAKSTTAGVKKKFLNITSPKGVQEGVMIRVTESVAGQNKTHTVGLNGSEVLVLRSLVQAAISRCLAW